MGQEKKILNKNFTDVSDLISPKEFEETKEFVLKKGGAMTYRNFDGYNPHYEFSNCDVFFGADIGQGNRYNNPAISDFNELTIADWDSDIIRYYQLVIVRKGDLQAEKAWLREGMIEGKVYLVDNHGRGLELMRSNLPSFLVQIKKELTAHNKVYKK